MKNIVNKYLSFRFFPITVLALISLIIIYPCAKFLPESFGYENGFFENLQMVVLFISCYFTLSAKTENKFFKFIFLVLSILILREINCGRTIFFPIEGQENAFYSVSMLKQGTTIQQTFAKLVHPVFGWYIGLVGLYFLFNKMWLNLINIIKTIKFPVINILLLIIGIVLGLFAEKNLNNLLFEELAELLFYVSLMGMIYLYSRKKI